MANEPTQAGQEVEVGFLGLTITGFLAEDGVTPKTDFKHAEEIDDYNGNVRTKVRAGKFKEISGTLTVDAKTEGAEKMVDVAPGDAISISYPADAGTGVTTVMEVQEWTPTLSRLAVRIQFTLRKEDAMTYTV